MLAATFFVCAVRPVPAHHAFAAEFDATKPLKLRGVVTKVEWINPHAWIHIEVKKPDGMRRAVDDRRRHAEHAVPAGRQQELAAPWHGDPRRWLSGQRWDDESERQGHHVSRRTQTVHRLDRHRRAWRSAANAEMSS